MPKKKVPLWLPYPSVIEQKKTRVKFVYNSGIVETSFAEIYSILFYGSCPYLTEQFLDSCTFYRIPVTFHRRNMPVSTLIVPTVASGREDVLTMQIRARDNAKRRGYIARRLLKKKFVSMEWLTIAPADFDGKYLSLTEMMRLEAWHAARYWKQYYVLTGVKGSRRSESQNIVKQILDAVSKFVSGILLRWITYHHLSPYHGFLHTPADYPALVYDLMEPYRGYFDKQILLSVKKCQEKGLDEDKWLAVCIEDVKSLLDKKVYTEATRQIVTMHELLHGVVLALRAYLLGEAPRFVVPGVDKPNGGRPVTAGYRLYGRSAGLTDFWSEAKEVAKMSALNKQDRLTEIVNMPKKPRGSSSEDEVIYGV
ncbi:MAG: hypothetical protein KatS3mg087_0932 [Patescibacteria group bacterium]|nr:MAG: hypothetical protein KatS3mg087_0932 [Patescibacteria group bacterium]